MRLFIFLLLVIVQGAVTSGRANSSGGSQSPPLPYDFETLSTKGFVTVRPDAHMFWWMLRASSLDPATGNTSFRRHARPERLPTILWLQGGPGGSSTGFGNFELIGPLDDNFEIRKSSWIEHANLLFIDSPVGTGYSYVTREDRFATTNEQIAEDLVVTLQHIYQTLPSFEESPLYIFSESYGGKMAVALTMALDKAIQRNQIRVQLKGIALGDPWISPADSVASWPSYLRAMSLLDEHQFEELQREVKGMERLLAEKRWENATKYWSHLERVIRQKTFNVNFYNVLKHEDPFDLEFEELEDASSSKLSTKYKNAFIEAQAQQSFDPELFKYKLGEFYEEKLNELMNTKVSAMLGM